MLNEFEETNERADLRVRALSRLSGGSDSTIGRGDQAAAFQALYDMALSPTTAPRALALLHELQVHQVELDLQEEELRRSRLEIETALARQLRIYDFVPVGLLVVDSALSVTEVNHAAARLLHVEREFLRGLSLDVLIDPASVSMVRAAASALTAAVKLQSCVITLLSRDRDTRRLNASLSCDPDGGGFLLAVFDVEARDAPVPMGGTRGSD